MNAKVFFFLEGNNGATYIVNTSSNKNISHSLGFYNADNTRQRLVKASLYFFSWFNKYFRRKNLKSFQEVNTYLKSLNPKHSDIESDDSISVLISPPRNKTILHYHNRYFLKIGVGDSYKKVKNESSIYDMLPENPRFFQLSAVFDIEDQQSAFSFKMTNLHIDVTDHSQKGINLVPALVELFNSVKSHEDYLGNYIQLLITHCTNIKADINLDPLRKLKKSYGQHKIPFGLVHKDFKPWNIKPYDPIHIFDFEDAVINGLPMEDLLNYFIDPIIRYKETKQVTKVIYDEKNKKLYNNYLNQLRIGINFEIFLLLYSFERVLFWKEQRENFTSKRYLALYESLSLTT